MPSAAQSEASRANGAKSSGPATAEGKARSARNSLRHGFTSAKTLILPGESREEYESIQSSLIAQIRPTGEIEENLVEELAIAKWRLNRIRRNQEQLLGEGDFLAALDDPEKDRKLRLLIRYEKDFERQYRAAYRLLLEHRSRFADQVAAASKAQSARTMRLMEEYITGPVPGEPGFRNEPEPEFEPEFEDILSGVVQAGRLGG